MITKHIRKNYKITHFSHSN